MSNLSAVLLGSHHLVIEDRSTPTPAPGQVLVQIRAVGICGSDVHYYDHGRIGDYVVEAPMVVGHEAAGRIVGVGERVDPSRVGELVALEPGLPCRSCHQCLAGRYNLCPLVSFFATPPVDGAISQFVVLDAAFAHRAPDGLTPEEAAMAEPVSVGIWAARKAGIAPGDKVLVTGAGPIGLLSAQVARHFGADQVTITDVSDFRLQVAHELGLKAQPAGQQLTEEYDVLIECSGAAVALSTAMRAVARAGRVVLVGMGADEVSISVPLIQSREITLTGTFRYANTYPLALHLIASGAVRLGPVITHHFDLTDTEGALTLARREPRSLKAVILVEPPPAARS